LPEATNEKRKSVRVVEAQNKCFPYPPDFFIVREARGKKKEKVERKKGGFCLLPANFPPRMAIFFVFLSVDLAFLSGCLGSWNQEKPLNDA